MTRDFRLGGGWRRVEDSLVKGSLPLKYQYRPTVAAVKAAIPKGSSMSPRRFLLASGIVYLVLESQELESRLQRSVSTDF